jgi:hypothetical protein
MHFTIPVPGRVGKMAINLKVLFIDAGTGFYRINRYRVGDFFGPVDLGLHLAGKYNSINIGTGLLAGSIFPGSNRLTIIRPLLQGHVRFP